VAKLTEETEMMAKFRTTRVLIALTSILAVGLFAACGSDDSTSPAPPVVDTVPPAIPGGVSGWVAAADGVALSWTANVTDPDLAGYVVYRSATANGVFRAMQTAPITANSWTDGSAQEGASYWYRVAALDASDNESGLSQAVRVNVPSGRTTPQPVAPQD